MKMTRERKKRRIGKKILSQGRKTVELKVSFISRAPL